MGVNSLPKTVTRQRRDCDLKPGPSAPEFSTLTARLPYLIPSHPVFATGRHFFAGHRGKLAVLPQTSLLNLRGKGKKNSGGNG